jgi:hypothetical protein
MSLLSPLANKVRATHFWKDFVIPHNRHIRYNNWLDAGRPIPAPPEVKSRNVLTLADLFGLDILIETGTYLGEMITATKNRFKEIYSIEIYEPLAIKARENFASAKNVNIILGDSATELPKLVEKISEPVLFWLDGHYSGEGTGLGLSETPIIAEIDHIIRKRQKFGDVIIIDDARCFDGTAGYPKLDDFLSRLGEAFGVRPIVADDGIFVLPK